MQLILSHVHSRFSIYFLFWIYIPLFPLGIFPAVLPYAKSLSPTLPPSTHRVTASQVEPDAHTVPHPALHAHHRLCAQER
jgi:hypothetical protein